MIIQAQLALLCLALLAVWECYRNLCIERNCSWLLVILYEISFTKTLHAIHWFVWHWSHTTHWSHTELHICTCAPDTVCTRLHSLHCWLDTGHVCNMQCTLDTGLHSGTSYPSYPLLCMTRVSALPCGINQYHHETNKQLRWSLLSNRWFIFAVIIDNHFSDFRNRATHVICATTRKFELRMKTPFAFHLAGHQNTLTARRCQFATPEISHHTKYIFKSPDWTWDICHKMWNKVKLTTLLQSKFPQKFKVFSEEP